MKTCALLIGIPAYNPYSGLHPLAGATDDVADVLETLKMAVPEPIVARYRPQDFGHKHWTRAAILDGARWLQQESESGDRLVFYFSGHGARLEVPEGRGDALEVIMPYDFRDKDDPYNVDDEGHFLGYRNYLTDRDLDATISEVVKGKRDMLLEVIIDSCYAVGMGDADYERGCFCVPTESPGIRCVLWAAALVRADYREHEVVMGDRRRLAYRSSFTYEFCRAVQESIIRNRPLTRRELLERVDDRTRTYSRLECCLEYRDALRSQPAFAWEDSRSKKLEVAA